MKQTTAANLTILLGIVLVLASPGFVLLAAASLGVVLGWWSLAFGLAAVYLGGLLIAVGVYVRLQSMSTAPTIPVTRLCPQCGRSNLLGNKYCDKCGAKLSTEEPRAS